MAVTAEGRQLTFQHRRRQIAIRSAILRDLLRLWGIVDPTNLSGTIGPFTDAAVTLVETGHRRSASMAVVYYQRYRQTERVRGQVTIIEPEPPDRTQMADLVRGAGLAGIVNARRRGFTPAAAARNGYVKASGSASDLVLAGVREVIGQATATDPRARGWRRVTSSDPCDFCQRIADEGVHGKDAGFEAHNHCACLAEPAFD
jgi:hypothetical protein